MRSHDDPVARDLARVAALVAWQGGGWTVRGVPVPAVGAPALAQALYAHWYAAAPDAPTSSPPAQPPEDPPLHHSSLAPALRAAHPAASRLVEGWVVAAADPRGRIVVLRPGSASRALRPGEYLARSRPGAPPAPGDPVAVVDRRDGVDERGLWWAFTETEPGPPLGRVYLDARAPTAPRVVAVLTEALEETGLDYQLKCPDLPVGYERVDSVVAYRPRAGRAALLAPPTARWRRPAALVDPPTPPLTCAVRPGLAWADDPGGGRSYGESRCDLLAGAIDAVGAQWSSLDATVRLGRLRDALAAGGVDPDRPWLAVP